MLRNVTNRTENPTHSDLPLEMHRKGTKQQLAALTCYLENLF